MVISAQATLLNSTAHNVQATQGVHPKLERFWNVLQAAHQYQGMMMPLPALKVVDSSAIDCMYTMQETIHCQVRVPVSSKTYHAIIQPNLRQVVVDMSTGFV